MTSILTKLHKLEKYLYTSNTLVEKTKVKVFFFQDGNKETIKFKSLFNFFNYIIYNI